MREFLRGAPRICGGTCPPGPPQGYAPVPFTINQKAIHHILSLKLYRPSNVEIVKMSVRDKLIKVKKKKKKKKKKKWILIFCTVSTIYRGKWSAKECFGKKLARHMVLSILHKYVFWRYKWTLHFKGNSKLLGWVPRYSIATNYKDYHWFYRIIDDCYDRIFPWVWRSFAVWELLTCDRGLPQNYILLPFVSVKPLYTP